MNYGSFQATDQACFLELSPGETIIDPGASQDLVGLRSFEKLQAKLKENGLKTIKLQETPSKASGVGGAAMTLFMALAPCILGGQPGVIKLTVVEDDIPQLLSIGLLEHGHAVIDTKEDKIHFKRFDTMAKMWRLPSGHRTLAVAEWDGSDFPVPPQVTEKYGLPAGACNLHSSDREVYMTSVSDAEFYQFFCLAGVSKPQVRQAKAVRSNLLGNFFLFPAFSDFAEHWNFRTSWITLGERACLLERNAKRHDTSDASFLSREFEVTDCQLDFTKQHWSESEIISLFSREEIHLSVHDAFITCLDTDRSLVASSKLETTLREDDKRAQYLISSYRNGDAGRAQHPCEEIKDPLRAGSGNFGESLVSLHEKAAHGKRRSSRTEEFEQERIPRGLHHVSSGTLTGNDSLFGQGAAGLHPSERIPDEGSQSTRHLDPMQSVSNQNGLSEIWSGQPTSGGQKDEGCRGRDLCGLGSNGHHQGADGGEQFRISSAPHARLGDGFQRTESTARAEHGGGDGPSDDASGGGISSSPSLPSGRIPESSGKAGDSDAAILSGPSEDYAADGSSSPARGCLSCPSSGGIASSSSSGICDGQSSSAAGRRGMGCCAAGASSGGHGTLRDVEAADSFTSSSSEDGTFKCTDSSSMQWMVVSRNETSRRFLSQRENLVCFTGVQRALGGETREVFVFFDEELIDEVICSEFPEGRESHLSKRQKRALLNSKESLSKSPEFSDEPKSSVVEVNQEWSQEQNAEPESLSRNEEEPDGQSRTKKEPVSQSRQARETVRRLAEQKCLTRPVRFDRNVTPSSQELSALGVVNVRKCRHGDLEKRTTSGLKVMELFSPPRITQEAAQAGLQVTEPSNFDLKLGWNALCPEDRKKMWKTIEEQEPDVILMSPDCKMFSQLMNVNLKRIPVERPTRQQMEALVMWHLCLQVAEHQMKKGRYFILEQPAGASSWSTHGSKWLMENEEVLFFFFDQCELGLQVSPEGLSRKTTALATNHLGVAAVMSQYQCRKSHEHVRLENGLPKKAQIYPSDMVRSLIQGILLGTSEFVGATHVDDVIDEDEAEQEGVERQPRTPGTLQRDLSDQLTEEQRRRSRLCISTWDT